MAKGSYLGWVQEINALSLSWKLTWEKGWFLWVLDWREIGPMLLFLFSLNKEKRDELRRKRRKATKLNIWGTKPDDLLLHVKQCSWIFLGWSQAFIMLSCLKQWNQKKKREGRLKSVWQEIYGLHDVSLICYLANWFFM